MGSMTGGDDDEGSAASSEPEIEYGSDGSDDDDGGFEPRIEERAPARDGDDDDEVGTSNTADTAAINEDVIDVDFAFDDPTPQISSEDSAIDAIDAINRREKASRAKTRRRSTMLTISIAMSSWSSRGGPGDDGRVAGTTPPSMTTTTTSSLTRSRAGSGMRRTSRWRSLSRRRCRGNS